MDSTSSRLPRPSSNPSIRLATSRLPAPSRLLHRPSSNALIRKTSIPLRAGFGPRPATSIDVETATGSPHNQAQPLSPLRPRSIADGAFRSLVSRSPPKRLLPSRSTLGVIRPKAKAPDNNNSFETLGAAQPLAPKRTVSAARTVSSTSTGVSASNIVKPSLSRTSAVPVKADQAQGRQHTFDLAPRSTGSWIQSPSRGNQSSSTDKTPAMKSISRTRKNNIKRELSPPVQPSRQKVNDEAGDTANDSFTMRSTTTLLRPDDLATPFLPRPIQPQSTPSHPTDTVQLNDTELSFVLEEADGDMSDDLSALCLTQGDGTLSGDSQGGSSFELDVNKGKSRFARASSEEDYRSRALGSHSKQSTSTLSMDRRIQTSHAKDDEIGRLRMQVREQQVALQAALHMAQRCEVEGYWGEVSRLRDDMLADVRGMRELLCRMVGELDD